MERLKKILGICFIVASYMILDIGLRYALDRDSFFVSFKSYSPTAFSISYVIIILAILSFIKKRQKLFYIITVLIANIYFYAQMLHFRILKTMFSCLTLNSAGEGSDYFLYAIKNTSIMMMIIVLLSILFLEIVLILNKKNEELFRVNKKGYLILLIIFVFFRVSALYKLGSAKSSATWDSFKVPRNVYNDFSNNNKSMAVSGIYEYIFRDIYLFYGNKIFSNKQKNIDEINSYIDDNKISLESNSYTGIYKDKNLIMIMLESIDTWLVTPEVMPTLYRLSKEGINFTNRYAPFFGAGMTINSEFASVTGLYSITEDKAIYNYTKNDYSYSLPSLFRKAGYSVNSMHMNNGDFYNRVNFHQAIGFEKHYPLYQMGFNDEFIYDSVIAKNEDSYNLIVSDSPFMTFITTYSSHVPYDDNEICNEVIVGEYSEIACLKTLAGEADKMIEILLKKLEDSNLLDDTVLVIFSDHYAYGYSNVENVKGTSDQNMLEHTPLVIWSNDKKSINVDTIIDTASIAPTVLNLFGIDYDPNLYIGRDVFSSNKLGYVFFNDYAWYDGNIYSLNHQESEYTRRISSEVNDKIRINKLIIKSDYYRSIK